MKHATQKRMARLALAISLLALSACAEWSSAPTRTSAHYGASVRNMFDNQMYDPVKTRYPAALAPDGIEGNKADRVLERAYREDLGKPSEIRKHTTLGTPGVSGSGMSGGTTQ